MSHSVTWPRNIRASGSSTETRIPSVTGVMQDMTMRPFVSASSLYSFTAHWRQAPTECSAGCQQK